MSNSWNADKMCDAGTDETLDRLTFHLQKAFVEYTKNVVDDPDGEETFGEFLENNLTTYFAHAIEEMDEHCQYVADQAEPEECCNCDELYSEKTSLESDKKELKETVEERDTEIQELENEKPKMLGDILDWNPTTETFTSQESRRTYKIVETT